MAGGRLWDTRTGCGRHLRLGTLLLAALAPATGAQEANAFDPFSQDIPTSTLYQGYATTVSTTNFPPAAAPINKTNQPRTPLVVGLSSACRDTARVESQGLGYWYSTWAKNRCSGVFQVAATSVAVVDSPGFPGQCELKLFRPFGDLKLRLTATAPAGSGSTVSAAWARSPDDRTYAGWREVNRSVCLLSGSVGAGPWTTPVPAKIVQFAFDAVSNARLRTTQRGLLCGQGTLSLVTTTGVVGQTWLAVERIAWDFYIEVAEGGASPASPVNVRVRVAEARTTSQTNGSVQSGYTYLGSAPSACEISAKAPFAAFGCSAQNVPTGRRLDTSRDSAEQAFADSNWGRADENLTGAIHGQSSREKEDSSNANHFNSQRATNSWNVREDRGQPTDNANILQHAKLNTNKTADTRQLRSAAEGTQGPLPADFDLRQQQRRCMWAPRSSGIGCGSNSWAWASVGAFEKQLCWLSKGRISQRLSVQRVLECLPGSSNGCGYGGGSIFEAHAAMLGTGAMVPEECAPTEEAGGVSPARGDLHSQQAHCPSRGTCPGGDYGGPRFAARFPSPAEEALRTPLHGAVGSGASATNVLSGEQAMKAGLLLYGALAASMAAYPELLLYKSGVLAEPLHANEASRYGSLAVQILGWGTEPASKVKYWIAENSWGPNWGENQDFEQCSVQECRGSLCPQVVDTSDTNCVDSPLWTDSNGQGCSWYVLNDPGCAVNLDEGQLANCHRACKQCPAVRRRPGEFCGFFRVLRGRNHLGIEAAASHTYVAGWAPAEDLLKELASVCADDPEWKDAWGGSCDWYDVHDPGCIKYEDYGQRSYCRRACRQCALSDGRSLPPASLKQAMSSSGAALGVTQGLLAVAVALAHLSWMRGIPGR